MTYRPALRGMDPEEAFRRFDRLIEAYFEIRLEGVVEPLTQLHELSQSTPAISRLALVIQEHLEWLRTWFPESTPDQLLHIADLTVRAHHRENNRPVEAQFVRLVTIEIGTIRARTILDHLDHGRIPTPKPQLSKKVLVAQGRKAIRRYSGG